MSSSAVLLSPLPYTDSDRIVLVRETFRDLNRGNASVGHFHDWTEHDTVFEHTAAGQAVTYNLADRAIRSAFGECASHPATSRLRTCHPPSAATLRARMSKPMGRSSS